MAKENIVVSDFNLRKLSTVELERNTAASISAGSNLSVFGRRGTGKTEIFKQQIAASGHIEVYINISLYERTDLGGYPDLMSGHNEQAESESKYRFIDFLLPKMYKNMLEGNKKVVICLDEVDKADPSLWAPLLELTQFRSINGLVLPNLHCTLMTGNLISEGGKRPSLPLLDRTEKYLVEADFNSWQKWAARSNSIHPSILAYLTDHCDHLFGGADPQDRYADPSPRSWHMASKLLYAGEEHGWSPDLLLNKVYGCVGKEIGIQFDQYYTHYQVLTPMINEIFDGIIVKDKFEKLAPTQKLVSCLMTCTRAANDMDKHTPKDQPVSLKYVGRFLSDVENEDALVSIRNQITGARIAKYRLDQHESWKELITSIKKNLE